MKKIITPKNVHRPFGYSHALQVGNTIYVSGQIPLDLEGRVVGKNDMYAQTEQAYENLKRVLEEAGATMSDIIMLNIYCRDLDEFDKKTRPLRKKYFGDYYPAITAVEVNRLYNPDYLIEVEAVAVIE